MSLHHSLQQHGTQPHADMECVCCHERVSRFGAVENQMTTVWCIGSGTQAQKVFLRFFTLHVVQRHSKLQSRQLRSQSKLSLVEHSFLAMFEHAKLVVCKNWKILLIPTKHKNSWLRMNMVLMKKLLQKTVADSEGISCQFEVKKTWQ